MDVEQRCQGFSIEVERFVDSNHVIEDILEVRLHVDRNQVQIVPEQLVHDVADRRNSTANLQNLPFEDQDVLHEGGISVEDSIGHIVQFVLNAVHERKVGIYDAVDDGMHQHCGVESQPLRMRAPSVEPK